MGDVAAAGIVSYAFLYAASQAESARATRTKTGEVQSTTMALRLSNINELNKLFQAVADAVREALQSLRKNLELLSLYVEKIEPEAAISFSPVHETIINQLEEIARLPDQAVLLRVRTEAAPLPEE